jgi:hypothetical protein
MNIGSFMHILAENYLHRFAPSLNEKERKVCLAFGDFVSNAGREEVAAMPPTYTWAPPACS